jgi:signal recognition particle subunit SRP68
VPVKPEKVRPFLAAEQELKESLERAADNQAKISLIENLLMDCKDAISAVKDELKNDPVSSKLMIFFK